MNRVSLSDETTLTMLGPAVYSEVTVNGVKITTLIDTGSPVTLMSLKKAVQILALKRENSDPRRNGKRL